MRIGENWVTGQSPVHANLRIGESERRWSRDEWRREGEGMRSEPETDPAGTVVEYRYSPQANPTARPLWIPVLPFILPAQCREM
jgi:hypothetical protein